MGLGAISGGAGGISASAGGGGPSGSNAETANNFTTNFAPRPSNLFKPQSLAVIGVVVVAGFLLLRGRRK